jgi:hypothetical protein
MQQYGISDALTTAKHFEQEGFRRRRVGRTARRFAIRDYSTLKV